jgi:bromodomain-containing protein 7/9
MKECGVFREKIVFCLLNGTLSVELQKNSFAAPAPGLPRPPTKDVFTILVKLQKKDKHGIFAEPVTEELAPDYFEYVKHPMDFSTIRKKNANGEYSTWVEVKADVDQMYKNAMIYNLPDNFIHKLAEGFTKNAMASFKTVLAKEEVLRQSSAEAKKSKHMDLNDADNGSFKSEEQHPPPSMLYNNNSRTPCASSNYSLGASSALAGGEPSISNRTLAEMNRTVSGMADATPLRSVSPYKHNHPTSGNTQG